MSPRFIPRVVVGVVGVLGCLLALAALSTPAHAAGLLIADDGAGDRLEQLSQTVTANVHDGVAVTTVEQTFHNHQPRPVNALYTLPLPENASVTGYSLFVGSEEVTGKVDDADLTVDPAGHAAYKALDLQVGPIPSNASPRIRITYAHRLPSDEQGWTNYVYPLAAATQPSAGDYLQGPLHLTVNIRSNAVTAMRSPSHRLDAAMTQVADDHHRATLALGDGSVAEDFVLAYKTRQPARITTVPAIYEPRPASTTSYGVQPAAQPNVVIVEPRPQVVVYDTRPSVVVLRDRPRVQTWSSVGLSFRIGDRSRLSIGQSHYHHPWRYDHWSYSPWPQRYSRHRLPYRGFYPDYCD